MASYSGVSSVVSVNWRRHTLRLYAPQRGQQRSLIGECMNTFPDFMKRPANRIAASQQATPGVEGYIFDGADGSQMAFWTCRETAASAPHTHDYSLMANGFRLRPARSISSRAACRTAARLLQAPERSTPLAATGATAHNSRDMRAGIFVLTSSVYES
jgi:hypothetical protein